MSHVVMQVVLNVEGDPDEMAKLFADYITSEEAPFLADYGKKAWGGYEGPFVLSASVHRLPTTQEVPSNDR